MGQRRVRRWRVEGLALGRGRAPGLPGALWIVALLAAEGLGGARPASAQSVQVPLTWDAPAGCPTAEAVLADVKRNLAKSRDGGGPFRAVVSVHEPAGGLWQASLRVDAQGGRAERQFQAETCEAIASAAALIVALSAEGGSGVAPAPAPREVPAVVAEPPSGGAARWGPSPLAVMVNGVVDGGTMPSSPAPGIEAAVGQGWTSPGWRLRLLVGAGFFPKQRTLSLGTNADLWLLTVSGRACVTATPARLEIGLCVGAELASMHAQNATTLDSPQALVPLNDATKFWVSPLGSAMVSWTVSSRVSVFARADVVVPSTQRTFLTTQFWDVYVVPSVATRGALGLEVRFL